MEWVSQQLGFKGFFAIDVVGRSGGIAFLWEKNSEAKLLSYNNNHIDMEIGVEAMGH